MNWGVPRSLFCDVVEIIYPPVCVERTAPSSRQSLCGVRLLLSNDRSYMRDRGDIGIEIAGPRYAVLGRLQRGVQWRSLGVSCCRIRNPNRFSNRNCFPAHLRSALRCVPLRKQIQSDRLLRACEATDSSTHIVGRLLLHFIDPLERPRMNWYFDYGRLIFQVGRKTMSFNGKDFEVLVKSMGRAGAEHEAETWLELTITSCR